MAGIIGYGLTLNVGGALTNVIDVDLPSQKVDMVDVTTNTSSNAVREFIAGLQNNGVVKFTCLYAQAQYATLVGYLRTSKSCVLTLNDTHTWTFNGFITDIGGKAPLGDKVVYDVSIQVTAGITLA